MSASPGNSSNAFLPRLLETRSETAFALDTREAGVGV
jgi:hypothetical protein